MNRNGQPTYLKNFLKIRGCKTYNSEFFSYFFTTINNLINSNMPDYLKIPLDEFYKIGYDRGIQLSKL